MFHESSRENRRSRCEEGEEIFFPRSLQPDPGLDTHTHTHTHPSRAARKVEEVEKVGGAYFKKKDKRGGGMLLSQCNPRSSLRFSAFPSLARHAIKPFFPWQTDAFCLLLSGQTARSEIIAARG